MGDKYTYKCTHCNQNGHTKDRCFEWSILNGGIIIVIQERRIPSKAPL